MSAVLFWLALFVISAFFIDPQTGNPKINLYLFHVVLFVISVLIIIPVFWRFRKKGWNENATFVTFLLVNILLDFLILIPFFGVTLAEWLMLVLPSYLIGTGIVYLLFRKKTKQDP